MPFHYRRIKLTVNLLLSIAQNPSLPSFNLLFKSNSTVHLTLSDAIPLHPRHYIRFPSKLPSPNHNHGSLPPNIRLDLLRSININFNLILEEYPKFIKCFTDGSKIRTKSACSFSINSKLYSSRLPNSTSFLTSKLTDILLCLTEISNFNTTGKYLLMSHSLSSHSSVYDVTQFSNAFTSFSTLILINPSDIYMDPSYISVICLEHITRQNPICETYGGRVALGVRSGVGVRQRQ